MNRIHVADYNYVGLINNAAVVYVAVFRQTWISVLSCRTVDAVYRVDKRAEVGNTLFKNILTVDIVEVFGCVEAFIDVASDKTNRTAFLQDIIVARECAASAPLRTVKSCYVLSKFVDIALVEVVMFIPAVMFQSLSL